MVDGSTQHNAIESVLTAWVAEHQARLAAMPDATQAMLIQSQRVLFQKRAASGVALNPGPPTRRPTAERPITAPTPITPITISKPKARPLGANVGDLVPVYTSIGNAILRRADVATGRAWLVLHHLANRAGRPLVDLDQVQVALLAPASPYRMWGTSQRLNQVLAAGEGRYWDVVDGRRLFIYGVAAVARALGVDHLRHRRVMVSARELAQSTKHAKRALYTAFHDARGEAPISRGAIATETGLSKDTQRRYERAGRVRKAINFELIGRFTPELMRAATWRHGAAIFRFTDKTGQRGAPGGQYVARLMPNSYVVKQSQPAPLGRCRRVNAALKGSVTIPGAGTSTRTDRIYYANPRAAVRASRDRRAYWLDTGGNRKGRAFGVWSGAGDFQAVAA